MKKIAVFPGSFDPFTVGHESIVRRALPLFDEIIIAVGYNSTKSGFFSLEKREAWIKQVFEGESNVSVKKYKGLTVDFCKSQNSNYILRGLRTSADFEFERGIGQMNKKLYPEIETIFYLTKPENTAISSSIVRDIFKHGGDVSQFLPKEINLND